MSVPSPYLFQVVPLLLQCKRNLKITISRIQFSHGRYESLYDLQTNLNSAEKAIINHVFEKLRLHGHPRPNRQCDIIQALKDLKLVSQEAKAKENRGCQSGYRHRSCPRNPQEPLIDRKFQYRKRGHSIESQLIFRLVVALQLLLVRIDDAHYVITGRRMDELPHTISGLENAENKNLLAENSSKTLSSMGLFCLGAGMIAGFLGRHCIGKLGLKIRIPSDRNQLVLATAKVSTSLLSFMVLKNVLNQCWMSDKIVRSNNELSEWSQQWELISCTAEDSRGHENDLSRKLVSPKNGLFAYDMMENSLNIDDKSRILIEYAKRHGSKSSFWRSPGEIRFLVLKRFMEIYYASIGVGVHCTKENPNPNPFFLPLVAGAAASFYTITGAPTPAVVNEASHDLIQHAWGMVSLPVLKDLMLQASRIIKGASLADRIVLCGVPCFILSKDPAPELAAVLQRQVKERPGDLMMSLSRLSTIAETEIHVPTEERIFDRKSFVGSKGQSRQRDVILHLTGGGFFAHTIASDLPYLLDWSSSTGSVVICPEYSLLPENQFPSQLNQVATMYAALVNGDIDLGFDTNSIIVTGESAGGNLAAALCVKLAMQNIEAEREEESLKDISSQSSTPLVNKVGAPSRDRLERMPDAIMLSCPALNLTTELSHSRVIGTEDPVLPSALISAISQAYVPPCFDTKDPLVSPFFASDEVLRRFPPALVFASSMDPLLDDSVVFNERLRVLGVDSELMAVHNVPHAYLGLGTAGFPEAVQVQKYAIDWMSSKLS